MGSGPARAAGSVGEMNFGATLGRRTKRSIVEKTAKYSSTARPVASGGRPQLGHRGRRALAKAAAMTALTMSSPVGAPGRLLSIRPAASTASGRSAQTAAS